MEQDYQSLYAMLDESGMQKWSETLQQQIQDYFTTLRHGDYQRWSEAISQLPGIVASRVNLRQDCIQIGQPEDLAEQDRDLLKLQLKRLMPWRKGPFSLFGINIDAEWRSDLKWRRLQPHIRSLQDRMVLDIGSGNGYYALRMLGEGARYIVGLDPTLLFLVQFTAINQYARQDRCSIVPLGIEHLPESDIAFDTVFSMGVLYHRWDPLSHLRQLQHCLRDSGELLLETLVIDGGSEDVLRPTDRYAKMNNVYQIPSVVVLLQWLEQAGFKQARVVDVSPVTVAEQRRTDWMKFESLSDFLKHDDHSMTIEGYPAPMRAMVVAESG